MGFFQGWSPGNSPIPMHLWAALIGSNGFGRGKEGGRKGEEREYEVGKEQL